MESQGRQGKRSTCSGGDNTKGSATIFADLWFASQAAFDGGDFETACDTLQAALAVACYRRSATQVTAVGQKAADQLRRLFQQAPDISATFPVRVDLVPTRRDAIGMVYANMVQQVPVLVHRLQLEA